MEDRRPKTEDRRPKTEDGIKIPLTSDFGLPASDLLRTSDSRIPAWKMNKIVPYNVIYEKHTIMERRKFLKSVGLGAAALYFGGKVVTASGNNTISSMGESQDALAFPALPFAYDALEPYIDARTMEIHYDKHHRTYFNNLVTAVKGTPMESMGIEEILKSVSCRGDAIRNNGGGYYNHMVFWNNLKKGSAGPTDTLKAAIEKSFGSFDKFKETFNAAAKTRFGSGWAWLYLKEDKTLAVASTPNQDNPIMDLSPVKGTPLLTLDVWEHAYYLKYQNKRADYIDAFWNVVNWEEVDKRYKTAVK
jgi:Fe-Mn family superoxide dismutase